MPLPLTDVLSSIDSKAALASPNGVDASILSLPVEDGTLDRRSSATFEAIDSSCFSGPSAGAGVGVGEADTTDPDFFLPVAPPPKKLFRVCCLPLNSSRNLVANRGGSGAVLGGSVGYEGTVGTGRIGGLSWSRMCKTSPESRVIESWRSMYTGQWSEPNTLD